MLLRKIVIIFILVLFVLVAGCQLDLTGPTASFKYIRQNENGGNEWLSRQAGVFNSSLPMVGRK